MRTGSLAGHPYHVVLFDFDLVFRYQLLFNQVPGQLFDALVIVLGDKRFSLFFVVQEHDPLEQRIGEFEFADFLHQVIAYVDQEFVVGIGNELFSQVFLDSGTEFLLVFDSAFAVHLVEDLLREGGFHKAGDLFHLEAEIGGQPGDLLFLAVQQAGQFGFVAVISFGRVEDDHVVHFRPVEKCLLFVVFHVERHQHGAFHLDSAFFRISFFVELGNQPFEHILVFERFDLFVFSGTLGIGFDLVVNHLIRHLDGVIIDFVFFRQLRFEFGSQGDVEHELEIFHRIEVDFSLFFFIGKGLAQHVQFVFADVFVHLFLKQLVHLFDQHGPAVLFLDQSHGNFPRTESRYIGFLTEILQ